VTGVAGTQVRLSWTSVPDAAQYWLYRRVVSGTYGAPTAVVTTTSYNDNGVTTGVPYSYVVRAVDNALNVSLDSNEVGATPTPQQVAVTFNVTVPAGTPVTSTVYIVGNQAAFCNWCNPHTVSLTLAATNVWTITLSFPEGTNLAYKYPRAGTTCRRRELPEPRRPVKCGNLPPRWSTTVVNWCNVAPCATKMARSPAPSSGPPWAIAALWIQESRRSGFPVYCSIILPRGGGGSPSALEARRRGEDTASWDGIVW
jgi:hypothetical protein